MRFIDLVPKFRASDLLSNKIVTRRKYKNFFNHQILTWNSKQEELIFCQSLVPCFLNCCCLQYYGKFLNKIFTLLYALKRL